MRRHVLASEVARWLWAYDVLKVLTGLSVAHGRGKTISGLTTAASSLLRVIRKWQGPIGLQTFAVAYWRRTIALRMAI